MDSAKYKEKLEARVGIEPTRKGFADLLPNQLTPFPTKQNLNLPGKCPPFVHLAGFSLPKVLLPLQPFAGNVGVRNGGN